MSTAPLPTRTRSIRKPSVGIDQRTRSNGLNTDAAPDAPGVRSSTDIARRGNQSPTRLHTRLPSISSSTTTSRITRAGSLSQRAAASSGAPGSNDGSARPRPTSSSASGGSNDGFVRPPRPSSISTAPGPNDGSMRPPPRPSSISTAPGFNDGSMRPPPRPTTSRAPLNTDPHKPSVSRPPMTSDNHKPSSVRSSPRTPTESSFSAGLQRLPSTRLARTSSVSNVSSSPPARRTRNTSISQLSSTTTLRPAPETKQAPNPSLHRAAFSTLQQHYSPAKSLAPKPTTASLLAPPTPSKLPSNIAISAETARLQAELLQLHLLHRDAAPVQAQWRDSAKTKLGDRFEALAEKHGELVALEEAQHGRANALALKAWAEGGVPGWGLEEKVQVLDEAITGLWSMGEAGGKYGRIVRRFEKWMHGVMEIRSAREEGRLVDDGEVMFVEEIDGNWRDECRVQARKLEGWRDRLVDLGEVEVKSSLATVVEGCRTLVSGMLDELEVIRRIERDVMRSEQEWIREMIKGAGEEEDEGPVAGAIWRRY